MTADVVVVGGGIIGLACAWRLAGEGLAVSVLDAEPGQGASHAAAGMLAPVTEAHYGEEPLIALNLEAASRWPSFAAELTELTGLDLGYRRSGTLAVGLDDDDLRQLDELWRFQESLGLPASRLDRRACRQREPGLSPRVRGGMLAEGDHQVDPRRVVRALLGACDRAGVAVVRERAEAVVVAGGRVVGVETTAAGRLACDTVVLAAGAWTRAVGGLPHEALPPVRPVKGQILRLRFSPPTPPLGATVRGLAAGRSVYIVPRDWGELVIGATVEETGFDTRTTAGGVLELLRAAIDIVPGLAEIELVEALASLRPGTPDNAPVLGASALRGLVLATGHHRNGILLAPLTAEVIAQVLAVGAPPPVAGAFGPERFSRCVSP